MQKGIGAVLVGGVVCFCILTLLLLTADFYTSPTLNNQKTYCNQN